MIETYSKRVFHPEVRSCHTNIRLEITSRTGQKQQDETVKSTKTASFMANICLVSPIWPKVKFIASHLAKIIRFIIIYAI